MSRKTEENTKVAIKLSKIFDRNCCHLEHQKWHFRASSFKKYLVGRGPCPQNLQTKGA